MTHTSVLKMIKVEELFGHLTYHLNFDRPGSEENMSLIYGENGSGKTTILRLLYATLSPSGSDGLRGYLTSVPFKTFEVVLNSGWSLSLTRESSETGQYLFTVCQDEKEIAISLIGLNDEDKAEAKNGVKVPELLKVLREMKLEVLFLGHDRELRSTLPSMSSVSARQRNAERMRREGDATVWSRQRPSRAKAPLRSTIIGASLFEVLQRQIIAQGNVGQINSNAIYLDLAKRLANFQSPASTGLDAFLDELDALEKSADPLLQLRSIPSISFAEFRSILSGAPAQRRDDLIRVLQPFIESTRARIDALTPLALAVNVLVKELSEYFRNKTVSFDLVGGFSIKSYEQELSFDELSSGEKHLFQLLCSAFLSRESKSLFIVDEPELSLNVYWQRTVPRTLQHLVEGADVNFLLATHSLEMLTEFQDRIWTLQDVAAQKVE